MQSPEYQHVLDRYIARLVSLQRPMEVLELYRREIDRNPDDPGLYERLAAFLDQRNLGDQVEQVYKQAVAHFQNATWNDKLARWYLRMRRGRDFTALSEQIAKIFSGTELERYFRDVVATSSLDPVIYRQVSLYAHQRFPDNLAFVRNLLTAYTLRETADPAAYSALLRAYWYLRRFAAGDDVRIAIARGQAGCATGGNPQSGCEGESGGGAILCRGRGMARTF